MGLDAEFISALLTIIAIDIVLGGDNAIVIALACRNLPEKQRNKAIFLGTGLAIVVRVLLTALVVYLLKIPYLLLIGGILLIYIAYNLLVDKDDHSKIEAGMTLGAAVRTIVFADIIMGLDNVLAIAGAAHGNIILVIIGLLISVPIIIWGSKLILNLMERFPFIIYIGSGVLAYTASHMLLGEKAISQLIGHNKIIEILITIIIILGVLLAGWVTNRINQDKKASN